MRMIINIMYQMNSLFVLSIMRMMYLGPVQLVFVGALIVLGAVLLVVLENDYCLNSS